MCLCFRIATCLANKISPDAYFQAPKKVLKAICSDLAELRCENIISQFIIFGGKYIRKALRYGLKGFHRITVMVKYLI